MSKTLSVCMIVRNEAHQLEEALTCIQDIADQLVIVDTGSEDETVTIAKRFTPHVYSHAWNDDFSAARNTSLERAVCDYCLWMDADDRIDELNIEKIKALKRYFDGSKAFSFVLEDIREGEVFRFLKQIRCIPNRKDVRFKGRIHESIDWERAGQNIEVADVDITIRHHGYDDGRLLQKKIWRNIRLLQKEKSEGRDDATLNYYLATSYEYLEKSAQAVHYMEKAIRLLEKEMFHHDERKRRGIQPFLWDAQLFVAEKMLELGRQEEAIRRLMKLSAFSDLDVWYVYRMACLYQKAGRDLDALLLLKQVGPENQRPTNLPTPRIRDEDIKGHMAFSLLRLDHPEEAFQTIETLPESVHRGRAWEILGFLAAEHKRYEWTHAAFMKAKQEKELSPEAWDEWGTVYRTEGKLGEARRCWERALQINPRHEGALIHLANLLWQEGKIEHAYNVFEHLIHLGCHKPAVLLTYGLLSCQLGKTERLREVEVKLVPFVLGVDISDSEKVEGRIFQKLARVLDEEGRNHLAAVARRLDQWASQT